MGDQIGGHRSQLRIGIKTRHLVKRTALRALFSLSLMVTPCNARLPVIACRICFSGSMLIWVLERSRKESEVELERNDSRR